MKISSTLFQLKILKYSENFLILGRSYLLIHSNIKSAFILTAIKNCDHTTAIVNISTQHPIDIEDDIEYDIMDPSTLTIVSTCNILFSLHRATNVTWQNVTVNKKNRSQLLHQIPRCIWFTGLSGAGKSSIANALEQKFFEMQLKTYLLDGDNLRHGLNRDLGFTETDRSENIRRVSEVAYLMVDAGLIVLASFISPYQNERSRARKLFEAGEFIEVFVSTPLSQCEKRDPKGLYAKCRRGEIKNFTGISSIYEPPENPELTLDTCILSIEECVDKIIDYISRI